MICHRLNTDTLIHDMNPEQTLNAFDVKQLLSRRARGL